MSEYTPITGELRLLAAQSKYEVNKAQFERCCDAIDAIHKNLEDENERLFAEVQRLTREREQAKASDDQYDMRREFDEWKHDRDANWMKLPVDADGVTIHENDLMLSSTGERELVSGVSCSCEGYYVLRGEDWIWLRADSHHHASTIESMLREYTEHLCELCTTEYACDTTREELLRQYADKLRKVWSD